jgi:hypothetical protein
VHGQLTELRWKREERVQEAEGSVMYEHNCWTRIYAAFPGSYRMLLVGVQIGAIHQFCLTLNQHCYDPGQGVFRVSSYHTVPKVDSVTKGLGMNKSGVGPQMKGDKRVVRAVKPTRNFKDGA